MGKTANLELNTTEMSDKISDFVGEYNSNMNMLDDLYGDVQDDASSALSTAQSADTKATAAQTAAGNAVTTANSANSTAQSANTTAGQANTAATAAQTAASNAVTTANEAKTIAQNAAETAEGAEDAVANKADIDGNYETLTVGQAEQLVSTVYVEDSEPYNFRTAGGAADIGDRMYEKVVGGSIVWNQHYKLSYQDNETNGVTVTYNTDGTITVNGTATGNANFPLLAVSKANGRFLLNHVYFVSGCPAGGSRTTYFCGVAGNVYDVGNGGIFKHTASYESSNFRFDTREGATFENVTLYPQYVDLTAMFGSTIADYIYSLEQGTEGAGVAWFRNLFPKPYYEYNAGELMSVKAGSHDTVGFNQINNLVTGQLVKKTDGTFQNNAGYARTDYIRVFPNTTYYVKEDNVPNGEWAAYYDVNKVFVSGTDLYPNTTFTTPSNVYYLITSLRVENVDNVCINFSWDGERNGEYEPYEKHSYPLANIELRGIPKLDANNQLYYDGDTYASDGTVTRKYGIIDLGTLDWGKNGNFGFYGGLQTKFVATEIANIITTKYPTDTAIRIMQKDVDKCIGAYSNNIVVRDSSYDNSTVAEFKSAMNGVYMVYELATPTTETADTFVNPQVVDDFGTEEYTDFAVEAGDRDVAIPVGHNSKYLNNLRAKLEMAPESPDGDGKYIVQQTNGENAYVPYTADGRLDAIEAKLPSPPSANGTYKLTAVVSNNGVTYSWTT